MKPDRRWPRSKRAVSQALRRPCRIPSRWSAWTQRLPGAALLIGNEGNGLLPGTVAAADKAVRIPMAAGVESLNAAVAGVLLWHFREV
ncbi:MAG: TrmH family RNA methyltransferase [Ruthenibacterium lactatiformans]